MRSDAAGGRIRACLSVSDAQTAYYGAQRLAARSRAGGDVSEFLHWTKVAAEVARIAPAAEMDIAVVQAIVDDEMRLGKAFTSRTTESTAVCRGPSAKRAFSRFRPATGPATGVGPERQRGSAGKRACETARTTSERVRPRSSWMAFPGPPPGLPRSTRKGSAMRSMPPLRLRLRGDRGRLRTLTGAIERGSASLKGGALKCRTIFPSPSPTRSSSPAP